MNEQLLGAPRYSPAETSRLVGMNPARVRRWLRGYHYEWGAAEERNRGTKTPVICRHQDSDEPFASFLDLIELRIINAFLDKGLTLHKIRLALDEAGKLLQADHPFARRSFYTEGKEIYLFASTGHRQGLLQLCSGGQWTIANVVLTYARQLDFSAITGFAERWFPRGRTGGIVVDPTIAFGAPTIIGRRTKTWVVHDLYRAESRSAGRVATLLGLTEEQVAAAVAFEEKLAA